MIDYQKYISDKLTRTLPKLEQLQKLDLEMNSIEFKLPMYPVTIKDDGSVWIPTGTRDSPNGISISECEIVVFINKEYSSYHILKSDLFAFIRGNSSNGVVERKLSEDFKVMGVKFNIHSLFGDSH
jgi:hypothetical protein